MQGRRVHYTHRRKCARMYVCDHKYRKTWLLVAPRHCQSRQAVGCKKGLCCFPEISLHILLVHSSLLDLSWVYYQKAQERLSGHTSPIGGWAKWESCVLHRCPWDQNPRVAWWSRRKSPALNLALLWLGTAVYGPLAPHLWNAGGLGEAGVSEMELGTLLGAWNYLRAWKTTWNSTESQHKKCLYFKSLILPIKANTSVRLVGTF